jgi:hypothetical protein
VNTFIPDILMFDAGPHVVWQLGGDEVTMTRNEVEALSQGGKLDALAAVLRWRFQNLNKSNAE